MFKKILFATDGSAASNHAAVLAVDLARVHGAKLTVVYVVDPYPYLGIGEANPLGFQAYMSALQEHSVQAFNHVKELIKQDGENVPMETMLVEEMAAHKGILHAATEQEADLIIVGSHGRSNLERFFLGGTANKVSSHAKQPVLIVR